MSIFTHAGNVSYCPFGHLLQGARSDEMPAVHIFHGQPSHSGRIFMLHKCSLLPAMEEKNSPLQVKRKTTMTMCKI